MYVNGRRVGATVLEAANRQMGSQEFLDASPHLGVAGAGLVQECGPLVGGALQGREEKRPGLVFDRDHGSLFGRSPLISSATRMGEFSHDR